MTFYCGMDLCARHCQVCVIDEDLSLLVQEKVQNDLPRIMKLIEPFKETLQIVVESTFNWYWLVDGLQDAGYQVCLAHTLGLYMITGAKVNTDRRDALALAKLLKAGMIPKASIYPKDARPIRDLLRYRSTLVTLRTAEYGGLRRLLLRHGLLTTRRFDVTLTDTSGAIAAKLENSSLTTSLRISWLRQFIMFCVREPCIERSSCLEPNSLQETVIPNA